MSEKEIKAYAEATKYNMESRNRTGYSGLGEIYRMVIENHTKDLGKFIDQIHTSEILEYHGMNYDSVKGMKEMAAHVLATQTPIQEMDHGMAR